MPPHLGDFSYGAIIQGSFNTSQVSTGEPFALAGTPTIDIARDDESPLGGDADLTLSVNHNSITGLNYFRLETAEIASSYFTAGSTFTIFLSAGTVDGVSVVGAVLATFTIDADSALKPETVGRKLGVASNGDVEAVEGLTASRLDVDVSTRLAAGSYVAPDNAGILSAVAGVQSDTDNLQTRLPASLVGGRMDSSVGAMATDSISNAAVSTAAVTKIQLGLASAVNLAVVSASTAAIKLQTDQLSFTDGFVNANLPDEVIQDIADLVAEQVGAEVATEVWTAPTRTLTSSAAETAAIVAGHSVTTLRGDEWEVSLTGLGNIAGREKLWITARLNKDADDEASLFQIIEGSGMGEGLVVLNGAEPETPIVNTDGAIVVDDETAGNVTITLRGVAAKEIEEQTVSYDIQYLDADDEPHTLTLDTWTVVADVTRAVS